MKTRYINYLIGILLPFCSCVDDKGSYDYLESPSVRITFDESMYDGVIGEEVRIEPNLFFEEGDNASNYEFEWQLNGKVVSNEQILSYIPKEAATYHILYSLIAKNTKIRVMKNLQLISKSPYKTGWAILSKSGDKALITQVRDDGEYIDYLDVYGNANGEELGGNPYKLVEHYSGKKTNPEILVINHDAQGPLELEGNSMTKVLYTTQEFSGGAPENFVVKNVAYLYYTDALLTADGQIYLRLLKNPDTAGFHSAPYSSVPAYFNKGMNITQIVPGNYYKTLHTLMYDEKNRRLLSLSSIYSDYTGEILEVPVEGLEDKALVYAGAYAPSDWFCKYMLLLKDAVGDYTVKTFSLDCDLGVMYVSSESDYAFSGSTYLTDKSKFDCTKDYSGTYLFFTGGASNNEIYYYERSTGRVVHYATCDSEITDIQLNKGSTTLGVGLKDGFVVYDVDEETIVNGEVKILHEVKNIGEVVDVIYRYGSPSNMYR